MINDRNARNQARQRKEVEGKKEEARPVPYKYVGSDGGNKQINK